MGVDIEEMEEQEPDLDAPPCFSFNNKTALSSSHCGSVLACLVSREGSYLFQPPLCKHILNFFFPYMSHFHKILPSMN